jgi:hypothetical protein
MAISVEEMYQQYAGRNSDPGGLAYWENQFGGSVDAAEAERFAKSIVDARAAGTEPQPVGTPTRIAELYQEVLGRPPESQAAINEWTRVFGDTIDASEYAQFKKEAQVELTNPALARVTGQILQQGTTGSWSGEGMGSTRANADAMANILTGIGITDINQFGRLEDGSFGNLVTGQAVSNTYGDRQTGDAFGGTYAGKGNTGFRAQFAADGTPVFYTSEQSSNTLANMLGDSKLLNLAANVGAGFFGGPLGVGALQLAQGNSLGDAARAALLTYGAGQLTDYIGSTDFGSSAATGYDPYAADLGVYGSATNPVISTPGGMLDFSGSGSGVDYNLFSGSPTGLPDMGGAQGFQQGASANLADMGGGQGLVAALGPPSTTLADALATFGGSNPASLASMGGGQGLVYQTPTGLVTQDSVIPTGGFTGNNSVVGGTGVNTAVNIGGDLGKLVDSLTPNYTGPTPGLLPNMPIDYGLARTPPTAVDGMGGGQGIQQGSSANLDEMGGGQGLTVNVGPPATTLEEAIANFGGVNPPNLDSMGGGQGLTYQTPEGLVTEGGVIPTGGSTGNNTVVSQGGINTAANIGGDLGKVVDSLTPNYTGPSDGLFTARNPPTAGAGAGAGSPSITDGLTPAQIANIFKAGIAIAGLGGGAGLISGAGGGAGGGAGSSQAPTQAPPTYGNDYYTRLQQYYDSYLPQSSRDVKTPLQQWYNRT